MRLEFIGLALTEWDYPKKMWHDVHMRVAITMPDATHRLLKSTARSEGCTMRELIIRGILRELESPDSSEHRTRGCVSAKHHSSRGRKAGVKRLAKP